VFSISMARVIGPTPPGTGLIQPARREAASKSISPVMVPSSRRLMPTSTTMAPGAIQSGSMIPGLPTALISSSAARTCFSRSRVNRCVTVTVEPYTSSSRANGRPTMFEAPTITACMDLLAIP